MTKQIRTLLLKEHPTLPLYFLFSLVVSFLVSGMALIPPYLMEKIIDLHIPAKDIPQILTSILWFVAIPIAIAAVSTLYKYLLTVTCRQMGQSLSLKAFGNLIAQEIPFFQEKNSTELAVYCRSESVKFMNFWLAEVPQMIASTAMGMVLLYILFTQNSLFALLALIYAPCAFLPSNWFAKKVSALGNEVMACNAKSTQAIGDTLKGIKVVKAYNLQSWAMERLSLVYSQIVKIWSKVAVLDNLTGIWVSDFSNGIFTGLVFALGALFVARDALSLGALVVVLNYFGQYAALLKKLVGINYNFKSQMGAYQKLFEIVTLPIPSQTGDKAFAFSHTLTVEDLHFSYDDSKEILKGASLTIAKGSWVGIVGQSGSGKSTLFDLLVRLYAPQKGRITLDGVPIDQMDLLSLRKGITRVSQEIFLFPLSIRENLLLANPSATPSELDQVIEQAGLAPLLATLPQGLDTLVGENGFSLSGGERQRLSLAQGLLRKSEILLLDEITANLDGDWEEAIRKTIAQLKRETGITVVSISHREAFLEEADRIYRMEHGMVAPVSLAQ